MREHGVIASIQPQFVPTDAAWLSSKLPQQLMSLAYPWKSLLEAGILSRAYFIQEAACRSRHVL